VDNNKIRKRFSLTYVH